MSAEDLESQIAADEARDKEELTKAGLLKMSPIEYARARKLQPQLVYYYIRAGHIKSEECICGRVVIDIESADKYLAEKAKKQKGTVQNG
jgi:hypothetical protein